MFVIEVLAILWLLSGLFALALCVAASKPVPPVRAKAQEGHARLELYGGRRQDVSSVCASKPKYGECPLGIWDDER